MRDAHPSTVSRAEDDPRSRGLNRKDASRSIRQLGDRWDGPNGVLTNQTPLTDRGQPVRPPWSARRTTAEGGHHQFADSEARTASADAPLAVNTPQY